ncbi:DUF2332 domain-containing protein [Lysinibacillus agricola]|uniref:DUF2332 domain-containing protein n=1 Tax=Lysinibacillus agricola TaxID=2590012 RepID=A0ABX7AM52_9BACI|nr:MULTISPECIES: DUF2332 domain-containing protein [Lysinibacillus]KOS62207.1 hypothetical protein AN161_14085 [Lysinibacillus sp. FJAT-14222]QQP11003.1 DUF2332 domain-containing protein [Lysinibacillus agricola]
MLAKLSKQFRTFAKNECENSSPLYEHLANKIADDEELLKVATFIPQGQPVPNLLLAGVQYLLSPSKDDLVYFYPSLTTTTRPIKEVYPVFKAFVLSHSDELKALFQEKLVQTNEIRRCSYLYPMMTEIYERHKKPLALLEIGASAGLQLGMDQYNYCYNQQLHINNSNNAFVLSSENRGQPLPASISNAPVVCKRVGIDLNPIDIHNEEELQWLQALIWPEHQERRLLLNQALPILKELDLQLIKGDAIKLIKDIVRDINEDAMLVVYHTHVANQIPLELRLELIEQLKEISMERPLYHCYNNLFDMQLHQDFIDQGDIESIRIMERPDGHARWFKWSNNK